VYTATKEVRRDTVNGNLLLTITGYHGIAAVLGVGCSTVNHILGRGKVT